MKEERYIATRRKHVSSLCFCGEAMCHPCGILRVSSQVGMPLYAIRALEAMAQLARRGSALVEPERAMARFVHWAAI